MEFNSFVKRLFGDEPRGCSVLFMLLSLFPQLWSSVENEEGTSLGKVRRVDASLSATYSLRPYYRRRDLEDPFFSDRFPAISHQNFAKFRQISEISLKYENLDITLSEIIEILRNSGKNWLKFNEKLQNLLSPKKINKNCIEFCQK